MSAFSDSPTVNLTVIRDEKGGKVGVVSIKLSRLLAYEQQTGFTRLRVSGGECVDVREGTDEIDHRVRAAAAQAVSVNRGAR
jgi:hypothetical protein